MFKSARIKLTIWYLLIIMAITLLFSSFVYVGFSNSTRRALNFQKGRIEREMRMRSEGFVPPRLQDPINEETLADLRQALLLTLGSINLTIFAVSGVLGYILAGKTLKPIENMVEKQNRFVSDAAHELRTPLTAMKTELEVTNRNKNLTVSEAKVAIESTIEEIDRLTQLSNFLLKESQYKTHKAAEEDEEIEISEVINTSIKKLTPRAKSKSIMVNAKLEETQIKGNKSRLAELITILLDNAIKYGKENGQVNITTKKLRNNLEIKVEDNGNGIHKKDLPYIFDRFYRAENSRTKNKDVNEAEDGFGLGLSIAKEIVTLHKGTITAESTINKGTTITINLPL